jgi:hypothetical protein
MKKSCITMFILIFALCTTNLFAQNFETIDELFEQTNEMATASIGSDNWNVVRIVLVTSEDTAPSWDTISKYDSTTPSDHGGEWLTVITEEFSYQPVNGLINVSATFNHRSAIEQVDQRVDISNGIYTGFQRVWNIERSFDSGEFEFKVTYAQQIGSSIQIINLHRELDIK